jgi:Carboxypeptidase regulatory-like domain
MKQSLLLLIALITSFISFAQPKQTVRGKIYDSETNFQIIGAKITLLSDDSLTKFQVLTNEEGAFRIDNVPVGKYQLSAYYPTYDLKTITLEVNSGKEAIANIPLSERIIEQPEVKITARKKGAVINEMALISAQQFSVEETNRYPGSRMDPARMASNFAGVQGADDSRNDIIIRGNSPLGVVYKVEGVDIPNPSHFAISGSTGGPVSIINNKILGNSDFFMSAFPSEYGNSTSGIFDLKLRNGNTNRHEFTGQFGFLGTEFLAEGPMSKNERSSYLVMGRYSTLSLFQKIGIQLGTDAVPVYGDAAFKFNFLTKKGGAFSFYGMGGKSSISILISEQKEYSEEFYGEGDRDQYFGTSMGVTGLSYKKSLNEKTYIASTLALSYDEQHANHNYLIRSLESDSITIRVDSIYPLMGYKFATTKASGFFSINHKINKQHLIKAGINVDMMFMNQLDSARILVTDTNFVIRWDYKGSAAMIQPFIQWKYRISDKMDFTAGIHSQYFSLSNSFSYVEPRLGWKLKMNKGQAVFAGAGMHSSTQPLYTYTYHKLDNAGNKIYHNKNMDFSRSLHTGLGYEKAFEKGFNIRTEVYYQYLYNIPVTVTPSSFSLINMGGGFARFFPDSLKNTGTGHNYGIELTVQKFFDKSFFFLFSGCLYDSKYTGSDGVLRNTSYNGSYVTNFLAGKEFKLNSKQTISLGMKVTMAGGKRYGYADPVQSSLYNEVIFKDSLYNERQFKDYFRADFKINWKFNADKVTHEIGLDLVNIFNTKNLLSLTYAPNLKNPSADPFAEKQQLGFLPIFYYKIDFRIAKKGA